MGSVQGPWGMPSLSLNIDLVEAASSLCVCDRAQASGCQGLYAPMSTFSLNYLFQQPVSKYQVHSRFELPNLTSSCE